MRGDTGVIGGNMHWRTFERLQGENDAHVNPALTGIAAKLGRLGERLVS